MKTKIMMLLFALFALPCFLFAAEQEEPVTYVIKQGDTLWGLSERFLKDPNHWPDMWAKNSEITNPHLIYPGQKVRVYADRMEFVPKEQEQTAGVAAASGGQKASSAGKSSSGMQEVAAEKSFTILGREGFLMEKENGVGGVIIGITHDRVLAALDDIVYTDIGSDKGAKGGEKYSVFRKDVTISHPLTSEIMGTKIVPLGSLMLTHIEKKSSRAIITKSLKEISPGAYLLPYKETQRREISLKAASRELRGYIVESYSGIGIIASGDIVYIDLGKAHGAEPGNMLYIVRDVKLDRRITGGRVDKLPQELLGAVVILETGNKTATALVVKSIDAVYKGDKIISNTK